MKTGFQKNWIQVIAALGVIALFSFLEYNWVPSGAKGNIEGGLLILGHYTLVTLFLLPLTIWAIAIVIKSSSSVFGNALRIGGHTAVLCAAILAPNILIPLIDTLK